MGQIQKSTEGLVNTLLLTQTGAELLQPNREVKAREAQDKANLYANTEVKEAYMKSKDAEEALEKAKDKATKVFDRYGAQPTEDKKDGTLKTNRIPVDESKLSKYKGPRTKQLNMIKGAAHDVNYAIMANAAAEREMEFKQAQYATFRERAEILSRKAKLDMPESLSGEGMMDKKTAWAGERLKGGKKNG